MDFLASTTHLHITTWVIGLILLDLVNKGGVLKVILRRPLSDEDGGILMRPPQEQCSIVDIYYGERLC